MDTTDGAERSAMLSRRSGTVTETTRVGFIGLGYMGHGMARNIRARGFPLTVMAHRKREAVDDLVASGAREVATPRALASQSDVVILCVTGAEQVDALVRGPSGLAAGAGPGLVVVDCTTSEPTILTRLAQDFPAIGFADAPLGRSPKEAWEGRLSVMVGGNERTFERIRPVLEAFADAIQYVGALGNGHRLKLVNNLVSLGYAALYAEALVLARKAGLGTDAFDQLIRSSRMHCPFYDTFMGWARDGNADSHRFALSTALHTISDVNSLGQAVAVRGILAASLQQIYGDAVAAGFGDAMLPELPRSVAAASHVDLRPLTASQ
jgi:3-hydroxyisobutyrate dehydrogenase-like beta-hydroxyacid dehydrogenase